MNSADEGYKTMLASFRTNDLQTLLGAFGRNKAGRKSELKDRALDLLRNRPTGFNYPAYIAKINEIYRAMQNDVPNNDIIRNMMQSQQRQMMSMGMQSQQQRIFQPPQYSQSLHLTRAGLPQVMPQMPRGIYGNNNNNIQYNYQSTSSRGMSVAQVPVNQVPVNQVPVNQQISMSTSDQGGFDMSVAPPNNFVASTPSLVNIKLRKLPFYEIVDEIIKPIILVGQDRCTIPNYPRGMREAVFKVALSASQCSNIALNRDISNTKNEYYYQMQLRICHLDTAMTEITDFMPLNLHIRIGNKVCPLPPTTPNTRPGTESRRTPRPINCSHLFKLCPKVPNSVILNWTPDGKTYVLGLYLVKKLSSETLLQKLKDKGARSAEETKSYIIGKLADVDPDLATTSYRFSLVCPLGKMRMTIPAKSITCDHLQCFDASIFILMNEKKPTWTCPTCNKSCFFDDIQIESYFLDIVSSPNLPDSCKEIEILANGTWKVYEEKKEDINMESAADQEKPIDSVNLDSDDGGNDETVSMVTKPEPKPESSKDSEKLKSTFVDLTISDDEEQPTERDRQENEAQAAGAIQPVTNIVDLKPQAQVQPQQAVTSSEQGVVIEIDSPSPPTSPATENPAS